MYSLGNLVAPMLSFAVTGALFFCCPALDAQSVPDTVALRNQGVMELLEQEHSSAYFEIPFGQVLNGLQEELGINIKLHESAIDNNLDNDTPITFSLNSVALSQSLALMLEPLDCTYSIEDGVLLIVSHDYAIENPMREVLDCTELLQTIKPYSVTRRVSHYGGGGYSSSGGGVFRVESGTPSDSEQTATQETRDNPAPNQAAQSAQFETVTVSAAEQLIDLLEETIDPDSWEVNGGTARVRELNGKLVIVQTAKNLREIKDLFASLK